MHSRYVCNAIEELRTQLLIHVEACESEFMKERLHNMRMLTEEIQTYVNRMEASLGDRWDMHRMQQQHSAMNKRKKRLRAEIDELIEIRDQLNEELGEEIEEEEDEDIFE